MVSPDLIELLRCPETMQKVRLMTPDELLTLNKNSQAKFSENFQAPLAAGLIREDGKRVFPIDDDIPVMLLDDSVVVG